MGKSLARVTAALKDAGLDIDPVALGDARTAAQAAEVAGCHLDQIAKSMVFQGQSSGTALLFLTAGGNQVAADKAAALAGEPLERADAALVRAQTGFAIGGVAPIGHLSPIRSFWDARLSEFETVWAAAGTPNHIFEIAPAVLLRLTDAIPGDFVA